MKYLPAIILLLLCAWLGVVLTAQDKPNLSPMVGRTLPALSLPSLEDETQMKLEPSGITLINFFASWCLPCQKEHAALMKLHEKNIFHMIGIAWKNKPRDANAFLAKMGMPYDAALYDMDGKSTVPFGLTGVPESFVMDGKGTIMYHTKSVLTDEIIERDIMPLIKEAK